MKYVFAIVMSFMAMYSCNAFRFHRVHRVHRTVFRPHVHHRPVHHKPVHHKPVHRVYHHHHPHHIHNMYPLMTGLIGGYLVSTVINRPQPVVQPQPVVLRPGYVWQDGHYEDQLQANGTVVRVWVPGRYIQVQ